MSQDPKDRRMSDEDFARWEREANVSPLHSGRNHWSPVFDEAGRARASESAKDRRIEALTEALREIRRGKTREDTEHPLGEFFAMAARFMNIATAALSEPLPAPETENPAGSARPSTQAAPADRGVSAPRLSAAPETGEPTRAALVEEVAAAFERRIGWHNDECPVARGHPWYACDCEVRRQAAGIRDLKSAAPAEPPKWKPTHRHYKGGLYREVSRSRFSTDGKDECREVVTYENEKGEKFSRWDFDFDGLTNPPRITRRFTPLAEPPKEET